MSSDLGKLAEVVAEMKTRQVSPPSSAAIVPINTHGQTLGSIETQIVQVLARGSKASVDETRIALLLGVPLEAQDVTDWAERLAGRYEVTWSRRERFGGLLFELVSLDVASGLEQNGKSNAQKS